MDVRKAILTVIVILAFALIATSLSQMTGFSVNAPTTVMVSPSSAMPGDTVKISINPGQDITNSITIYKSPSMTRVANIKLECGGYKCKKGNTIFTDYTSSLSEQAGDYIVEVYDTNNIKVGSGRFTVL